MKKPPTRTIPTHLSNKFTVVGADEYLVEASDLLPEAVHARIWNDSYETGFWFQSHLEADDRRLMVLKRIDKREGEVVAWVFAGAEDAISITILND